MDIDVQKLIFEFVGGLGIFLFGIKYMGDGLQKSAGSRLREILNKFTTNPIMGIITGAIVTILIQSSSGTTVLTVGLVNAGFMTLRQAIGVIMGANIGTTATAFIIGVDLEQYALPAIAVGTLLIFFFNKQRVNYIGQIIFGLGALFYGLKLMSGAMEPLRSLQSFHDLTVNMSEHTILGVVIGAVFTLVVQSSSATIGILQALFDQGAIKLHAALPVLFGDNIGTTVTALFAAIGATVAAKRAALVHVIFNLLGTVIALFLISFYRNFIDFLGEALNLNSEMQLAFAHGIFNISNTIIQFPLIGVLAYVVTKLIPGNDSVIDQPSKLDPIFIEQSPSVALGQAQLETLRMGGLSKTGLQEAYKYLIDNQKKHAQQVAQSEEAINDFDKKITDYLIKLSSTHLSDAESSQHSMLMDGVRDIERIGDHTENIIELIDYKREHKVSMTQLAMEDLEEMFNLTISTLQEALTALENNDVAKAKDVLEMEDEIDQMERTLRKKHIMRLNKGECSGSAGIVYVDILSNLERIGDHSVNIAERI
ncbi:Na/Pi cotransporter family protein [Tuberibacillus sp. Marseille-P3662]|uniref:Na/Pi cotransporter family protein n=1 Tax=Tuberibacillus sp. Marseille-P3662 TaxID=1965358 RepID=UPI000A1C9709|nr:Na/Pi cotransporter family protein [Tuberibacillus sp. Marseille-P3662]